MSALRTVEASGDPAGPLLVLPVALVALAIGRVGGLFAACIALGLFVVQHEAHGSDLTDLDAALRRRRVLPARRGAGPLRERGRTAGGVLREAESGYRDLLGRLPAIVYTSEYGSDGPWRYVSPGIESTLGYTVEEWTGRSEPLVLAHASRRPRPGAGRGGAQQR